MKDKKITIGRLIITLLMLAIVVVGGTYAWFSYASKKAALVLTIGDINDAKMILKPYEIRETMIPVNTYTSGVYSEVETVNNGSSSTSISLYYKINELNQDLAKGGLKYTITSSTSKDGTYEEVKTGDFSSVDTDEDDALILETKVEPSSRVYYRVYLWLDSSAGNQTALQNTNLDMELNGTITQEATKPVLIDGMIPVIIENDGTVSTISSDSKDWYDYGNKKWANIVLVNNSARATYEGTTGKAVSQSDILAYYVWIPRYRYKIWTTGVSSSSNEQTISIVFESANDPMTLGTQVGEYRTHSAFWFDGDNDGAVDNGETLAGIWVGKFETTGSTSTPTVLPNTTSLTNQNISSQFATSLLFSNGTFNSSTGKVVFSDASNGVNITDSTYGLAINTDSHMIKNNEWGAVAYLSHSQYGINNDVRINNYYNNVYKTGCGASSTNGATSATCEIIYGSGVNDYPQSTTGNITGIFDMSGGAHEYVMGNYGRNAGNSGFTKLPDSKYYDLYTNSVSTTACNGGICFGHALSETSGWYSSTSQFVSSSNPWFLRGGNYGLGSNAGVFYANGGTGNADGSFRSTLITLPTYTVSYNSNTGTGTPSNQIKVYGVDLTLSNTVPVKANYSFKGWNTSSNGSGTIYSSGGTYANNATTVLYAIWTANNYTIAYTLNGGTAGTNAPTSGTYDSDVQISNPTKTVTVTGNANGTGATVGSATSKAQTFAGWTTSSGAGLGSDAKTGTSANPSTAWSGSATKNTYFRNLTDTNGTVTLTANWTAVAFNLPTVTKTGYTCKWNTASDGSGTDYASGASYTPSTTGSASVTMYAICTANSYKISYSLNNGTAGSNAPTSGTYNNILTISNPTKTVTVTGNANGTGATVGSATSKVQTFAGWTAGNLNTSTAYYGTSSSAVSTLWNDASTKVTAQYFKNLTASSGATVTLTANWTAVAFNLPTVTKTGYTCKWNTASDGSGTDYASGASYTPSTTGSTSVTMYAICTVNSYTITYKSNVVANGDFSLENTAWNFKSFGTVDTNVKYSNSNSVRIMTNSNGWDGISTLLGVTYKNNTKYKISLKTYRDSSSSYGDLTKDFRVYVPECKSDGTVYNYRHYITINSSNLPDKAWTSYSAEFTTATSEADRFRGVSLDYKNDSGTSNIWVSDIKLEEIQTQTKEYNTEFRTLPTVSRNGYTFGGWFTGENGTGTQITTSTKVPASNQEYYAKWTPNTYKVTLNNQGATSVGTTEYYYQFNNYKTINGVTAYYYTDSSLSTPLTNGYTITKPTKTGYTFGGYYTGTNGSGTQYVDVNGNCINDLFHKNMTNITLYAKWTANKYTIAYTLNSGTAGTNAPTSGTYDSDVQISNPTKTVTVTGNANNTGATVGSATSKAQTFAGWTTNSGAGLGNNAKTGTAASPSIAWTGSTTTNTYFRNLRDTSGTVTLTANWTAVAFNLPTVTKTGYTCKWNTKADGSGTNYASGASYTPSATSNSSITMYAICSANSYKISYSLNNGTAGSNAPTSGTYNNILTISNPTKTVTVTGNANGTGATVGSATSKVQTFAGWTAGNLNTSTAYYGTSSSAVSTLWNDASTKVTAQYFKNLTASSGATVTLTANWTAVAFNLPTVTKTGYTCKWNTASDGSGTDYASGASYTPSTTGSTSVTMYAICSANSYTITYYNGSTKLGISSHTYGTAKALTTWSGLNGTVTNSSYGWSFVGWSTSNSDTNRTYTDGQSVSNLSSTSGGNISLYAVYQRTITFKHGASAATSSSVTQYWNSYGTTNGTHISGVTSPALTAISNWTSQGFRNDTTAGAKEYNVSATIYPAVAESATLYGVYSRTITFYSGVSKATTDGTVTQYLNANGNAVSSVKSYTPASISNWTTLGYRDDTSASAKEYDSASSISPIYTTGNSMYAVYSRTLTITYNGNGNTGGSTSSTTKTIYLNTNSTATSDQAITLASNGFNRTGYTFSKWAAGSSSGTQYTTGSSYTAGVAYDASTFGVTMYAIWTANNYTLTINPNGGTYNSTTSNSTFTQAYDTSKNIGIPTPPSGYTVTFNGNGGTPSSSSLTSTRSFSGWTKSGTGLYVSASSATTSGMTRTSKTENGESYDNFTYSVSSPTSNTWYYFRYPAYTYTSGDTYEIRFKLRINSISGVGIGFRHSALANDYGTPGRVEKVFSSANASWQDVTLTRTMSGTTTTLNSNTVTIAPVFEGVTGNMLNTDSSANFDIKDMLIINKSKDTLLQSNANSFLFRAGSGTLTANYTNNSITLPTATKTGYTFKEWNTASDGSGTSYASGASYTPNQDTTLYAIWTVNKVYINYHVNGGTVTASTTSDSGTTYNWTTTDSIVYLNGSKLTSSINYGATMSSSGLPNYNNSKYLNITRTGYSATSGAQWMCSSGCTTANKIYDQDTAYTASDFCDASNGNCTVTLKVNWKINTYTVSYNACSGSGAPSSQTKTYGQALTLSSTKPTRSGYTFKGWSTSGCGATSATYAAGGSYTTNAAATMYAVWEASSLIQSYSCANTSSGSSPYSFTYTGNCEAIDDGNDTWRIKFLTSGTFTPTVDMVIDAFLVGGGGGGGQSTTYYSGGGGGGGGYTTTTVANISANTSYSIVIGSGGSSGTNGKSTTAFGSIANGGYAGNTWNGGSGGSGGGGGGHADGTHSADYNGGNGGSDGSNGLGNGTRYGTGQGTTTREFGESTGTLYSGGGGGGSAYDGSNKWTGAGTGGSGGGANGDGANASANTGGGGGGGRQKNAGGTGGSGIVVIRKSKSNVELDFTYTGSYQIVDEGNGDWKIKFLTSGTFTPTVDMVIDAFLVGGGGGGGQSTTYYSGGGGGGGGYTTTTVANISANTSYSIVIGSGGSSGTNGESTTAFGSTASGGYAGNTWNGGSGGSGGGGGGHADGTHSADYDGGNGGSDGSNGLGNGTRYGTGQGTTTREFGESTGTLYSGGGGGGSAYDGSNKWTGAGTGGSGGGANGDDANAEANTGGGGGGGRQKNAGGTGGSGIVVIRNTR